jgi:hypothetical protein
MIFRDRLAALFGRLLQEGVLEVGAKDMMAVVDAIALRVVKGQSPHDGCGS